MHTVQVMGLFFVITCTLMIIHSNLSKTKNKILPTCLQGNYRDSLGEFSNTSYGVFGAERVNPMSNSTVQGRCHELDSSNIQT